MAHGYTLRLYRSPEAIAATIQLLHHHSRNGAVMKHTLDMLDKICTEFSEYRALVEHLLRAIPQEKWRTIQAAASAFASSTSSSEEF
jgi:RecA-family ATPase